MALNLNKNLKLYYSISEVAEMFGLNESTLRYWEQEFPEKGEYAVYISYKTLPQSSPCARYSVRHAGGTTDFVVNQKMGGGTWIYLGTFEFEGTGSVTLYSEPPKGYACPEDACVTADAVRFGGGMGKVARGRADLPVSEYSTSGMPSFCEGAIYWMQWAGADTSLLAVEEGDYLRDYSRRGAWVGWMSGGSRTNPDAEGLGIPVDLSLAFHTDAGVSPDDSIIGTLAIYTLKCEDSDLLPNGESRLQARSYADFVQTQIVEDIKSTCNPQWSRRGLWDRSYSESRTTTVPALLVELLSHQNFADMKFGLDPSFRFLVSRAIYKGVLKYLSARYGCPYEVQPLPVNSFRTMFDTKPSEKGKTGVTLSWKDYNDNGLSELLALYGSGYNVNIKIFNDLQHTITGWPGGKPNADDASRPERATPYPKRVVCFSPHPDDVVVSMGGTLRRLVQQGHDVHVVFQTNGDMMVNDEDLERTIMLTNRLANHFDYGSTKRDEVVNNITETLRSKKPGDADTPEIRYAKGAILECECVTSCRFLGVSPDKFHELNLPFYSRSPLGNGKVTEADVTPIKDLLQELKPHQIFFADDYDPNGVNERASEALILAVMQLKNEPWMKDCRLWMYRGQWGQWEIDNIEMTVPMSPEEFGVKRQAILKHQSQVHDAPFRDPENGQLAWQTSIDRNTALADLYSRLGLASYEAMEAFVRYHIED